MRNEFTARERQALLEFIAGIDLFVQNAEKMERILNMVKYGKRDYKMLTSVSTKLYEKILECMDVEQLVALRKNMQGVKASVRVPKIVDDSATTTGRWLSFKTIEELTKGCHEKCLMCSGTGKEFYDCTLRKALNDLPTDLQILENETQQKGKCPYTMLM